MPRVTQVCWQYTPANGGTTTAVGDFYDAVGGRIVTFVPADEIDQVPNHDGNVLAIPMSNSLLSRHYSWCSRKDLRGAEEVLRQSELIICHVLFRYHIQWATRIAREADVPYLVVPHGGLDPYVFTYRGIQKKLWLFLLGQSLMRNAQCVLFATQREREKAEARVSGIRSRVIHWPVDSVDVSSRAEARNKIRLRHGIPLEAKVLIFIGRLHPMKRPLETIMAFGESGLSDVHLVVVGPEGPISKGDCERLCADRHIDRVHLIGGIFGSEKFDYYMAADAFILLSWRENFGYTVAEALMCGIPVILSPGVDLAPELAALDCGWVLESTDLPTVRAALLKFADTSSSRLMEMGARGRKWALDRLSVNDFARAIQSLAIESI